MIRGLSPPPRVTLSPGHRSLSMPGVLAVKNSRFGVNIRHRKRRADGKYFASRVRISRQRGTRIMRAYQEPGWSTAPDASDLGGIASHRAASGAHGALLSRRRREKRLAS
jgi:hypothetical protein